MATLKDVARLACVDVSTVSRALNNTSYVHPDTKVRIFAAVKELSYQPNVLAQGLRQGKRHTIGFVVPRLYLTVFADIAQSVELEARKRGYATLICHTEDDAAIEKQCLNRIRNGFVDGIIIAGTGHNGHLLRDIHSSGMAVLQIVRKQEASISSVIADYDACGYDTVKYLVSKGCREIGLINGSTDLAPYRERYNGYHRAMEEAGLPETIAVSTEPSNSFQYGYQCAEELLDQNPELDAIMAAVDIQGMAVMRALKKRGIRVPEQIRLVSLTGHSVGELLETSMTSLEIPAAEMGEKATQMLIGEIETASDAKPSIQHLVFSASLVERESS
ncbi:MAG: LacI family DNA-binding transcriptional regulator [Ruthenibacterium sp.]